MYVYFPLSLFGLVCTWLIACNYIGNIWYCCTSAHVIAHRLSLVVYIEAYIGRSTLTQILP